MQNLGRNFVYELLDVYYDHPSLVKVKHMNGLSLYAVRLPCLLLNEKRYLVVLTSQDSDVPMGSVLPLAHLRWKSFMTRILEDAEFE